MKVRLISYTTPSQELIDEGIKDLKELVVFCARVSNPNNQTNTETTDKLINYLIKHKHFSPFEMVSMCMEIETTRDIGRQILRHRSFSFQEFSQRYADPTSLEFTTREPRYQDKKNRQASTEFEIGNPEDEALRKEWFKRLMPFIDHAIEFYSWAIKNGIAKEQARCVFPEGLTPTRFYMQGSLRSWIHYLEVRATVEGGTQKEHREIAQAIAQIINTTFPLPSKDV